METEQELLQDGDNSEENDEPEQTENIAAEEEATVEAQFTENEGAAEEDQQPEEAEPEGQEDETQWMKVSKNLIGRIEALEHQNQEYLNSQSSLPPNSKLAHRLERRRQRALRKHRLRKH